MKKILFVLLISSCVLSGRVEGVTLEGGIEYTVERARREVFSKVSQTISMSDHEKYKIDPGYSLDRNGKAKIKKFGRNVTFFSNLECSDDVCNGYSIVYQSNKNYIYYYDNNGKLLSIDYDEDRYKYPRYSAKYNLDGKLVTVFFIIKPGLTYSYSADKTYLGKWVDDEFYDRDNKVRINQY